MLNLYDNDDGANPEDTTPPELDVAWDKVLSKNLNFVYGDFFVCGVERYIPGRMQHVHILRVRHLTLG